MDTYDLSKIVVTAQAPQPASAPSAPVSKPAFTRRDYKTQPRTLDEIREELKDFEIVPYDQWKNLRVPTELRYINTSDCYKWAGWYRGQYEDKGKRCISVESKPYGNSGQPGYLTWKISFDNIKVLYKRTSVIDSGEAKVIRQELKDKNFEIEGLRNELFNEADRVGDIAESVDTVRDESAALKKRVEALEAQVEKLKIFVSRMYDGMVKTSATPSKQ